MDPQPTASAQRPGLAQLDHLVVATASLAAGCRWLQDQLGVTLQPGGQHLGWGTHNQVLQIGGRTYLELIAPDPRQSGPLDRTPSGRRPFRLDDEPTRSAIAERPRLIHYVARTALQSAVPGYDPGPAAAMTRGSAAWSITLHPSGLPTMPQSDEPEAVLPTLIEWRSSPIPADALPDAGVTLARLAIGVTTRQRAILGALFGTQDHRIVWVDASHTTSRLSATFVAPAGEVTID